MSRSPRLFFTAAITVLLPFFAAAEVVKITRGPYPQAATPESIHLVWRVRQNTQPVVRYGIEPGKLDAQTAPDAAIVRRLAGEGGVTGGAMALVAAPPGTRQYGGRI